MNQFHFYALFLLFINFTWAQTKTPPSALPAKTLYQQASTSSASVSSLTAASASSISSLSSAANATSSASSLSSVATKGEVPVGSTTSSTAQGSASSEVVIDGTIEESEEQKEVAQNKVESLNKQIKLLEEMVNIGSDTKLEVAGVNKVQDIIAKELKALKFKVDLLDNPDAFVKSGKLLVATYPGKNTERFITLLAHSDTVFPAMTGFVKFERLSEQEARGPGVIDNKGGVVVALEALKLYLQSNPNPEYSLRFIVSPSEEVGSTGFLGLFEQYSLSSVAVFGVEPAMDKGDIVTARKGDRWYEVKIKGREAHAGRGHEEGVNACHELAIKIEKIQKLTNYKREVTINVGDIRGGKDKFSIVCGEASMKLDVRYSGPINRKRVLKAIEDILKTQYVKAKSDGARATTEWKVVDDPMPFTADPAGKNLVEMYKKMIFSLEANKITARSSGGTSDINYFYRPGIILIDGLGPIGSGMHTHDERIHLRSLQTRAEALSKLIQAASL